MLEPLRIRIKLEKSIRSFGGDISGSGTDLETGCMDISFSVKGQKYRLTLAKRYKKKQAKD